MHKKQTKKKKIFCYCL